MKFLSFDQGWIPRQYQQQVVSSLLELGLLKHDNSRNLPLKSGGTTDIYINLRDARDRPEAITYLADLFKDPLRCLDVSRFVEVPDSVSCFAGPLSVKLNMPYLTMRGEAKEGRVANAKVIGHSIKGERVALIDDVITDAASKVEPYHECLRRGLDVAALVVLVDRQQGWKERVGLSGLSVWFGMTLHDVRRELIGIGAMRRCDPDVEKKNPIIVALDGKSWDEIFPVVDSLRTTGCILKVNDLLFAEGMDHLLPELSIYGRVMVDLKSHDIPNTVENTCCRLAKHRPLAVTVHASGGTEMIQAAVKALAGTETKVLAITALTSLDDRNCQRIYGTRSLKTVRKLANIAFSIGAHGIVCSPREVSEMKLEWPGDDKIYVTPGVMSDNAPTNDQARISTPKGAMDNGANYIVMGRQIIEANDPVAEVKRVLSEELGVVL